MTKKRPTENSNEGTFQASRSVSVPGRKTKETVQGERITELEDTNVSQRQEIADRKVIEEELKHSLRREKLTRRLIQLMSRSFDVNTILKIATRSIGKYFEADRCWVIRYDREGEESKGLQLLSQYCSPDRECPVNEEAVYLELSEFLKIQPKQEHPLVFLHAPSPSDFPEKIKQHLEEQGVQSVIIIEIKYRDIRYGWMVMHQCTVCHAWEKQEVDFLDTLVAHIGSALYQAELYQQEKLNKQNAEEANRQKTRILSFVSHDFKNPLDGILRFIEILRKDESNGLSPKHRELVEYIDEGIRHLRYMVTDILDKARLEEGRIVPEPHEIELKPFLEELWPIFHSMATPLNVDISIELEPALTSVYMNPTHLRQILTNLVSNAIKYNQPDGKTFLKFYRSESVKAVIIEIRDVGIGISPEEIPKLFTEYYRADLTSSNPVEGAGLGLSFIKKLIELQGGNIQVQSNIGVGTTFTVTLPDVYPE